MDVLRAPLIATAVPEARLPALPAASPETATARALPEVATPAPSARLSARRLEAYRQAAATQENRRFEQASRQGLPLRAQQAVQEYEDTAQFARRDELSSLMGIDLYA